MPDESTPWEDDCGAGSSCIDGRCRGLCWSSGECGDQRCFGGSAGGVCLDPCDPLAPSCPPGLECRDKAGRFACLDPLSDPIAGPSLCGESSCGEGQTCITVGILPDGWAEYACTDVCDVASPTCPPGLECVGLWNPDRLPELEHLGACKTPK